MSQLRTIQVARGVAANLVVFSHLFFVESKYTVGGVLPPFTLYGISGVDLFFVLSGFIMVAVAGRDIGPIEFLWRRATRIYPTYWLVSLAVLAVAIVAPTIVNSSIQVPISLWRSFLLIPDRTLPLLAVGWTLVHEMYFYLVFAIILALRIPILAGLIGWGVIVLVIVATFPDQIANSPVLRLATSPLTAEFMMGAAVGLLWRKRHMPGTIAAGGIGLAGLVLSIGYRSTGPVAGDQSTSRRLAGWHIRLSFSAANLCPRWYRTAVPETTIASIVGGLRRLVLRHLPNTCSGDLSDWAGANPGCPSGRHKRERSTNSGWARGGQYCRRRSPRSFRAAHS